MSDFLYYHIQFEFILIAGNHLVQGFIIGDFIFFLELQSIKQLTSEDIQGRVSITLLVKSRLIIYGGHKN